MLKPFIQFDRSLFQLLNRDWSNSLFDWIMPFLRNQFTWTPVYLFLLLFVVLNFGKKAIWWILFFLATFAITDIISAQVIKTLVERPRPCWDPVTANTARMLIPCSHAYSFVSSHAANHFGISMFIFQSMKHFGKPWVWLAFLWAALVSYGQVYTGAHFPLDVAGGALLGLLAGAFTSRIFIREFKGLQPGKTAATEGKTVT
jgi:membrane-associated phospholipid phosphatase